MECKALRNIVSSSTKAEIGRVFYNAQTTILIRYILECLGHYQLATPIKTDNSTASTKNTQSHSIYAIIS